jgi:hypothetical protein
MSNGHKFRVPRVVAVPYSCRIINWNLKLKLLVIAVN